MEDDDDDFASALFNVVGNDAGPGDVAPNVAEHEEKIPAPKARTKLHHKYICSRMRERKKDHEKQRQLGPTSDRTRRQPVNRAATVGLATAL